MTTQEVALRIIKQEGDCQGMTCTGCPFFYNDPTKPIACRPTPPFNCAINQPNSERVPIFIQYLIDTLGEQTAKELLLEELI